MTDDLVKRLQYTVEHGIFKAMEDGKYAGLDEALARIEALEAALREIAAPSKIMAKGEDMETALKVMLSSHRKTAIAALAGEKKDG